MDQTNPAHPLEATVNNDAIQKVKEFITVYGPYITLSLIVFRFYTQFRLNKTLARVEEKLTKR